MNLRNTPVHHNDTTIHILQCIVVILIANNHGFCFVAELQIRSRSLNEQALHMLKP